MGVIDRLEKIEAEYEALEQSLASPEVLGDQAKLRETSRKYKQQTPLVQCIREYKTTVGNAEAARELLEMASGSEREALDVELNTAQEKIAELEERLKVLLLPPDPNDGKNVIVEIRGAEGGMSMPSASGFLRSLFAQSPAGQVGQWWPDTRLPCLMNWTSQSSKGCGGNEVVESVFVFSRSVPCMP